MIEKVCGSPGSDQHLVYQLRLALNPFAVFGVPVKSEEERQWAIKLLSKAFDDLDKDFFPRLASGVEALRANDPNQSREVKYFLFRAYDYLRRNAAREPAHADVVKLTKRVWAIALLTGRIPDLPLPRYKPEFEAKISDKIDRLPKQKWSRHTKAMGLQLRHAKAGRPRGRKS